MSLRLTPSWRPAVVEDHVVFIDRRDRWDTDDSARNHLAEVVVGEGKHFSASLQVTPSMNEYAVISTDEGIASNTRAAYA